ncbi:oligoribonuclease [Cellulosimicrobium sp. Marseille-Q4280]|uniref:oligoribonuclease n=1 Tax=Cellulosimicrobium sp. Marseille-Q4280 TaxID=2937992 RepID=UPI00203EAE11|nr:oligoribonuclease [Cellulosimicrobium sp. Marseille-Q4280]
MTTTDYPEVALAWVDVETTDLNPWVGPDFPGKPIVEAHAERGRLLEIAMHVTDLDLNVLDGEGLSFVVAYSPEEAADLRQRASGFVQQMHANTGLWDRIADPKQSTPLDQVDKLLTEHLQRFAPEARTARVAGNSVRLDLNYLEANVPSLYQHAHYRMLDVSSWAGPAQWWCDIKPMTKKLAHTATGDIRESIAEMRYLRDAIGMGPKPMTIAQAAAELDVSRATVDRMLRAGHLRVASVSAGGQRRVEAASVHEFRTARMGG